MAAAYDFTSLGFLQVVSDASDGRALWAATDMHALGHVTREFTRNGVETVSDPNPATGWLMGRTSTAHVNDD